MSRNTVVIIAGGDAEPIVILIVDFSSWSIFDVLKMSRYTKYAKFLLPANN